MDPKTVRNDLSDMQLPKRPETLPEIAEATLEALSKEPLSENVILGGGIALKHYDDFRATQDIDAWWKGAREDDAFARFRALLDAVASARGLTLEHRRFGTTDSLEFKDRSAAQKVFSFQISVRDVALEDPVPSAWPPILVETLVDNVGSKMNALVNRGAPRDFVDIFRIVNDGLISSEDCWRLWQRKNEGASAEEARAKVLTHLTRLEVRRPLGTIGVPSERESAAALRQWYREGFLVEPMLGLDMNDGMDFER